MFHDLRRSAVRNLIRAGVPEQVVMRWIGHRTHAMLQRYNIVSREDLELAGSKFGRYLAGEPGKSKVVAIRDRTVSAQIGPSSGEAREGAV